jgi:hypothetical protein
MPTSADGCYMENKEMESGLVCPVACEEGYEPAGDAFKSEFSCVEGVLDAANLECREIDPCLKNIHDCSPDALCEHTGPGTHSCTCNAGFTGTGQECEDIDECKVYLPCDPIVNCTTEGSRRASSSASTAPRGTRATRARARAAASTSTSATRTTTASTTTGRATR